MHSSDFEPTADSEGFIPRRTEKELARKVNREVARGGYRVYRGTDGFEAAIAESLIEHLVAFGRRAAPKEWYALLAGRICEDEQGRHVVIDGAVFDDGARTSRGHVETTVESEVRTRGLATFLYPAAGPVGWCHGHVEVGARYSGVDRDNQRTWTQPHSIGIVVDPWDPNLLGVYRGPQAEQLVRVADRSEAVEPIPTISGSGKKRLSERLLPEIVSRSRIDSPHPAVEPNAWDMVTGSVWIALTLIGLLAFARATRSAARLDVIERDLQAIHTRAETSISSAPPCGCAAGSSAPGTQKDASAGP